MIRPPVLSREKTDTLLLLLGCSLTLGMVVPYLLLWINIVVVGMMGWRVWLTIAGRPLPHSRLVSFLALMTLPALYLSYDNMAARESIIALLVLVFTCKLLEMRARRDTFVVVCLCFFLMMTGLLWSQSMTTAALMLAAVLVLLTAHLSFQYGDGAPAMRYRLKLVIKIVITAAPLTLMLFFLFPRIQGPLWGTNMPDPSSRSGMSDTMAPGNITKLALSEEVAFRARFNGAVPPPSALYWRGLVMTHYDGRTWRRAPTESGSLSPLVGKGQRIGYQVMLEPSNQHWLYALDMPTMLPALPGNAAFMMDQREIITSHPLAERVQYDMISVLDYALESPLSPQARAAALDLPPGFNPRTLALAAQLRQQLPDAQAQVNAVLAMIHDQPFRYTLMPPMLGRDAVDDFLFESQSGFCEHYASAFVVLMRALGIPARVVNGYMGGQYNPIGDFLTVRDAEAHAWTEVWMEGRGWVRIDPTTAVAPERVERRGGSGMAQSGLRHLRDFSLVSTIRLRMDAMTDSWNRWVLHYTPKRQANLLRTLGLDKINWLQAGMVLSSGIALILMSLFLSQRRKKRINDPVERLYQQFCEKMRKAGMEKAPHEAPRTYSTRLCAESSRIKPNKRTIAAKALSLIEESRYAKDAMRAPQTAQYSKLVRDLRRLVRAL